MLNTIIIQGHLGVMRSYSLALELSCCCVCLCYFYPSLQKRGWKTLLFSSCHSLIWMMA